MLTRDQILALNDVQIEKVSTPEWGKKAFVFVRGLTGEERDRMERENFSVSSNGTLETKDVGNTYGRFAARVICDESGNRLFSDTDAEVLGKRSARALARIWKIGQQLSGMTKESIEEIEKNSLSQNVSSGSN